jgi:alcohol dehydrogenase (cytochrome c)
VGVSGDVTDVPGYLDSRDPETGALQWRWYSAPKPGDPGSETWPKNSDAITHGGGMTWMTGSYDPELKLVWYFQPSPHDVHDWDAVQTPMLFDGDFRGQKRKMVAQASRNGYFFVLDRKTGEHLLTTPFVETNWAKGINTAGQPIRDTAKDPTPDGSLVSPGSNGSTNWLSPSFDPQTGMAYVSARRQWSVFYKTAEGKAEGWGGRDRNLYSEAVLEGIDYQTGEVKWKHEIGPSE